MIADRFVNVSNLICLRSNFTIETTHCLFHKYVTEEDLDKSSGEVLAKRRKLLLERLCFSCFANSDLFSCTVIPVGTEFCALVACNDFSFTLDKECTYIG